MKGWLLALGLKPLLALAIVAGYYFGILLPVRWLRRRLPNNRVVDFLFRERGRHRPGPAANADQRLLD